MTWVYVSILASIRIDRGQSPGRLRRRRDRIEPHSLEKAWQFLVNLLFPYPLQTSAA